jgi:hypothetical protein
LPEAAALGVTPVTVVVQGLPVPVVAVVVALIILEAAARLLVVESVCLVRAVTVLPVQVLPVAVVVLGVLLVVAEEVPTAAAAVYTEALGVVRLKPEAQLGGTALAAQSASSGELDEHFHQLTQEMYNESLH